MNNENAFVWNRSRENDTSYLEKKKMFGLVKGEGITVMIK